MVRRCVVPACMSTDQTTLVHRFPRKHCRTWQKRLSLNSYRISDLLDKYVVCAHHFRISDYRNAESKHLNTTALPSLDIIPENEKNPEILTAGLKVNKRNTEASTKSIIQKSNSNSVAEKTKIYSNCFTLSSSSPLVLTNANDLQESDDSDVNNFNSDCDVLDEEMLLETSDLENLSNTKHLLECEDITEYLEYETDDDNVSLNCDKESGNNLETEILNDCLTKYVELIETNEESDDECDVVQCVEKEISSSKDLYNNYSKSDLIEQLVVANNRIKELETKLANIQKAHLNMIQNLNNFNKVLIN